MPMTQSGLYPFRDVCSAKLGLAKVNQTPIENIALPNQIISLITQEGGDGENKRTTNYK